MTNTKQCGGAKHARRRTPWRKIKMTRTDFVRTATAGKKALQPVGYMVLGATILAILGFTVWSTINADVLWKAMRYPEAVRQMEVEILVKK